MSSRDHLTAGEDRDILQHGLTAIAESRGLDGRHVERAAELVHHQSRQGFAFYVFREDHERLAQLGDLLENRQQVLHAADLLLRNEDERVFHDRFHPFRIGHEVGGDVAAVELHAFDHIQGGGRTEEHQALCCADSVDFLVVF